MKKRISCKVIRSVPLGKNANGPRSVSAPVARPTKTRDVASFTYTDRLIVTKTNLDNGLAARKLDFYV